MGNPFEFDTAQQLFAGMRAPGPSVFGRRLWPGFKTPISDGSLDRTLDTARVARLSEQSPWRDDATEDVTGDRLGVPRSQVPWPAQDMHMGGWPIQLADPERTMTVTVAHRDRGTEQVEIPAPRSGWLAVEGNPWPSWRMATDSNTDNHSVLIGESGESWEMIGVVAHHGTWGTESVTCSSLGRYRPDGVLLSGRHVTKSQRRASSLLLGRAEPNHRLGLVVRGDDRDPHAQPIDQWVGLPHSAVPWADLTRDAHRLATMLVEHGAWCFDRGAHSGLGSVAGAEWAGIDFGGWRPLLGDFRIVESGVP